MIEKKTGYSWSDFEWGTVVQHDNSQLKRIMQKGSTGEGEISSFQALMSSICSTVGMGNIAGVAIAISIGGAGAIFWMWVSALLGMATKFFEGTLAIMYKGKEHTEEHSNNSALNLI